MRFGVSRPRRRPFPNGGFRDVTELQAAPAVIIYQPQERAMPHFVLPKDPIFSGIFAGHAAESARG
jgi:hypothetical protein